MYDTRYQLVLGCDRCVVSHSKRNTVLGYKAYTDAQVEASRNWTVTDISEHIALWHAEQRCYLPGCCGLEVLTEISELVILVRASLSQQEAGTIVHARLSGSA